MSCIRRLQQRQIVFKDQALYVNSVKSIRHLGILQKFESLVLLKSHFRLGKHRNDREKMSSSLHGDGRFYRISRQSKTARQVIPYIEH